MFFYASKIFWTIAQPLSLILILGVLSLVFAEHRRWSFAFQVLAMLTLATVSFTNLGAVMIGPLENRFPKPTAPEAVSSIIVLGGATSSRVGGARGVTELNGAADRMTVALQLARQYPDAQIIFTGGIGTIISEGETEAASARRFFIEQGIDASRLVLEDEARNTDENAQLTAQLLGESEVPPLLVTSAFHMPRSVGLFRKAGVTVVPWPVDYRSTGQESWGVDIANPVLNLEVTGLAMREWIGLLAYSWTGRIDETFPGPK